MVEPPAKARSGGTPPGQVCVGSDQPDVALVTGCGDREGDAAIAEGFPCHRKVVGEVMRGEQKRPSSSEFGVEHGVATVRMNARYRPLQMVPRPRPFPAPDRLYPAWFHTSAHPHIGRSVHLADSDLTSCLGTVSG